MKLEEHLGDGQKTVWFLAQRIRRMMEDDGALLRGVVEAGETYLGGKRRKGRKSKRDNDGDQPCPKGTPQGVKGRGGTRKAMVAVPVERKSKGRASKAGTHSEMSLAGFIWRNVDLGSVLCTDELPAYRWIGSKFPAHQPLG